MLNPPNPLEQSNTTVALNLLNTPMKSPFDRSNPLNNHSQSSGLTGKPFYQSLGVPSAGRRKRKLVFLIMSFKGDGMVEVLATLKDECDKLDLKATSVKDSRRFGLRNEEDRGAH